ncbi:MAG: Cof-type HAD-IIB family hydrolase [Pyrinomonadaceae bacterium]|nr:Cof-type HAD-IIB family hydrolase [Pyrinomonadaceae bacterium]
MSIRLLALDLDGTLLNSRGELSERNRAALAEARRRGVIVAVVTGRRFRDARPLALELGLDAPVISHNGALTKHARTLETVAVTLLPLREAREVLRLGRERELDAMISDDAVGAGVLVYDHINDDNHAFRRYIEWSRRIHGDEAEESVRRVDSLEEYLDHEPVHITYSGTCAAMEALAEALKCEMGARVKVFATLYRRMDFALIDVLNPQASKGTGVAAAAAEAGIKREEVMAVGDNFNDLEMLDFAGTGVLMGNADARLLSEKTDLHVTTSNDEDGVAEAIERFILNTV